MSDPKPTAAKREREPSALSSEYHKAHKQVMLWATILFIWELVGVDLDKAKDAGGNVGPVVTALKSPQAVPWVLLILVFYFLFKCSVEWAQCHPDRRKIRFARIDFSSAWMVSTGAIALYVGQALSRVQLADAVTQERKGISVTTGLCSGMALGLVCGMFWRWYSARGKTGDRFRLVGFITMLIAALFYVGSIVALARPFNPKYTTISLVLGLPLGLIIALLLRKRFDHLVRSKSVPLPKK